jgi:hypothetical protein
MNIALSALPGYTRGHQGSGVLKQQESGLAGGLVGAIA